jgi:hypothetical protein
LRYDDALRWIAVTVLGVFSVTGTLEAQ